MDEAGAVWVILLAAENLRLAEQLRDQAEELLAQARTLENS